MPTTYNSPLLDRCLDPDHWELVMDLLMRAGLPQEEAFAVLLGTIVDYADNPEAVRQVLAGYEIVLN